MTYEALLCPGCGKPIDEAWSPDETHAWVGEFIQCGPCRAIDKARETERAKAQNGKVAVDDAGAHWVSHRRGDTPLSRTLRAAAGRDDEGGG